MNNIDVDRFRLYDLNEKESKILLDAWGIVQNQEDCTIFVLWPRKIRY